MGVCTPVFDVTESRANIVGMAKSFLGLDLERTNIELMQRMMC